MEREVIAEEPAALSATDSERIKRGRFEADPTCSACTKPIETIQDAMLLENAASANGKPRQLLIHNACFGVTLDHLVRVSRIPQRRY